MYLLRLTKGMDLKKEIIKFCEENNIKDGIIGTCVGCCYEVRMRLAGGEKFFHGAGDYEIVSMTGTISENGVHIHAAFSDNEGVTVGGHLIEECLVNTTAEIAIIEVDNYKLTREMDEATGYKELVIEKR